MDISRFKRMVFFWLLISYTDWLKWDFEDPIYFLKKISKNSNLVLFLGFWWFCHFCCHSQQLNNNKIKSFSNLFLNQEWDMEKSEIEVCPGSGRMFLATSKHSLSTLSNLMHVNANINVSQAWASDLPLPDCLSSDWSLLRFSHALKLTLLFSNATISKATVGNLEKRDWM